MPDCPVSLHVLEDHTRKITDIFCVPLLTEKGHFTYGEVFVIVRDIYTEAYGKGWMDCGKAVMKEITK
jgi:hypothetical protein